MFQRLLGIFVSGLVIFLPVVHGGSTVRVCREFMKLGGSLVRVTWHSISLALVYASFWNPCIFQSVHLWTPAPQ
jgi:hypothetical protein